MKKTLLATTAIVALGGAAYAEVSLSGYAEIGIKGGTGMETQFHDDIDVSFSLTGETDNGLSFGAKIDLDEADVGAFTASGGPQLNAVFVSGAFGTITLGDTDGAFDKAMIDVGSLSSLTDDHTTHSGYSGNSFFDGGYDGQILRYDYSFGDVTASVSAELDDSTFFPGDPVIQVGVGWSGDFGGTMVGVGLGYATVDTGFGSNFTEIGISASASAGGIKGVINYTDFDASFGGGGSHTAIGVTYTVDALAVHVNWGQFSPDVGSDSSGWGFAANYDLGGGAVVMAGYGNSSPSFGSDWNTWSLGLGLSF